MRMFIMKARELIGLSSWSPEDIFFQRKTAPKIVEILGDNLVMQERNGKKVPALHEKDGSWRVRAFFPDTTCIDTILRRYVQIRNEFGRKTLDYSNITVSMKLNGALVSYRIQ